jgi:catechol-2,3-dioxygenase
MTEPATETARPRTTASEAPAPVGKLLYTGVRTRDVGAMVAHYRDVLRFELVEEAGGVAYLSTGPDHHCVVVEEGEPDGRSRVGYLLHGSLEDSERRLTEAGIEHERRTDPEPGVQADLIIREPVTGTPLHLIEMVASSGVETTYGLAPTKLGHAAVFVADLGAIQGFYEEILGFKWSDTIGDFFIFMRCNAEHHAANFIQSDKLSGLHHVAYEMRDIVHLKNMLDQMAEHDVRLEWGPGRHGPGHNIFSYHFDPDENVVELFTELDVIHDDVTGAFEPRPWHDSFPQVPRVWKVDVNAGNVWGPVNPVFLER